MATRWLWAREACGALQAVSHTDVGVVAVSVNDPAVAAFEDVLCSLRGIVAGWRDLASHHACGGVIARLAGDLGTPSFLGACHTGWTIDTSRAILVGDLAVTAEGSSGARIGITDGSTGTPCAVGSARLRRGARFALLGNGSSVWAHVACVTLSACVVGSSCAIPTLVAFDGHFIEVFADMSGRATKAVEVSMPTVGPIVRACYLRFLVWTFITGRTADALAHSLSGVEASAARGWKARAVAAHTGWADGAGRGSCQEGVVARGT